MNAPAEAIVIKQHLIDPEICIRCNTCESVCPVGAVTHDSRNYVVDADRCNLCMACIPPCPTGSIDNWRSMPRTKAYSVEEQLQWDVLPAELTAEMLAAEGVEAGVEVPAVETAPVTSTAAGFSSTTYAATLPPWSAAHAYTNLYGPKAPVTASAVGNFNCT
jgi:benzoyl-CoA 2,3-epoxidase subunit A